VTSQSVSQTPADPSSWEPMRDELAKKLQDFDERRRAAADYESAVQSWLKDYANAGDYPEDPPLPTELDDSEQAKALSRAMGTMIGIRAEEVDTYRRARWERGIATAAAAIAWGAVFAALSLALMLFVLPVVASFSGANSATIVARDTMITWGLWLGGAVTLAVVSFGLRYVYSRGVTRCEQEVDDLAGDAARYSREAEAALAQYREVVADRLRKEWKQVRDVAQRLAWSLPPVLLDDWESEVRASRRLSGDMPSPVLALATARYQFETDAVTVPFFAPFVGRRRCVVLRGNQAETREPLQSLVLQCAMLLHKKVKFTLLDPNGGGTAFPMRADLTDVRPLTQQVSQALEEVEADAKRIIGALARDLAFHELPAGDQLRERYEIIVAAGFPMGYDRRSMEVLMRVAQFGPQAGKYVLVEWAQGVELPHGLDSAGFANAWTHCAGDGMPAWDIPGVDPISVSAPAPDLRKRRFAELADEAPVAHKMPWSNLGLGDPERWWRESSTQSIEADVGWQSGESRLRVWFGQTEQGTVCAHGLVAGSTGSGKSNFLHALIAGLATRYSPNELNLYLVDLRDGAEFQYYRELPHARVVAMRTDPALGRSVLLELQRELVRRNTIFTELADTTGAQNLGAYRAKGSPSGPLPRILLIVDEYQKLFEDDPEGTASISLEDLVRRGRSSGIHLLLSSQQFGATGMFRRQVLTENSQLRIALKMDEGSGDLQAVFGRDARDMIRACRLAGQVVINDGLGQDGHNQFGQVAFVDADAELEPLVSALRDHAVANLPDADMQKAVVFRGDRQPDLIDNPQLSRALRSAAATQDWTEFATDSRLTYGLDIEDWPSGEPAAALWLGQELNMYGHAAVPLWRRARDHVLLLGDQAKVHYGMLSAMLVSASVFLPREALLVQVFDGARHGSPWAGALPLTAHLLADAGWPVTCSLDEAALPELIADFDLELSRRQALAAGELAGQPTHVLALAGVGRVECLQPVRARHNQDDSGTMARLKSLLLHGSQVGIHVILYTPDVHALMALFGRREPLQTYFRHRVATRIPEPHAGALLGDMLPSRLANSRPVPALYYEDDRSVKFKPYSVETRAPWEHQVAMILSHLREGSSQEKQHHVH
jgi:DNA segregation ATPase FtsK/SpoIIIE, S-DNA-T family